MNPSHGGLNVAILDDYQGGAWEAADWQAALPDVRFRRFDRHFDEMGDLAEAVRGCQVIVTIRERVVFDDELLERLPDLRMLVLFGSSKNRAIDFRAASDRGVLVCGTRSRGDGVIELCWGLMLALARHIPEESRAIGSGGWQVSMGMTLNGRSLGVVGLGKHGSRMATIGAAFGMDVIAWSPHLTPERAAGLPVTVVTRDELFSRSDVVTIHMALGPSTVHLIGADDLALMQDHALLLNTSRGLLVDERALVDALHEGAIGGAGLDVFATEPLAADHPLRTAPRCVLTPHLGYVTRENFAVYVADAIENIQAFVAGEPMRLIGSDG